MPDSAGSLGQTPIYPSLKKVREVSCDALTPEGFEALVAEETPAIIRGGVSDWPLVRAGRESAETAIDILQSFAGPKSLTQFHGPPKMGGKFFYTPEMDGFNFAASKVAASDFFASLKAAQSDPDIGHFYAGSTDTDLYFSGFRDAHDIQAQTGILAKLTPIVSLWMGNETTAAAHYDMSNNLACNLVGERRFTLFPPEQIANLYPGPLAPTPAGQTVSMVDFNAPDFDAHPNFKHALEAAEVAELHPGDVLFYPALWWHQVEALAPFNVMMNYWWNDAPAFMDTPMLTLMHGLLSLRDRSAQEKAAWKALFDYYLFDDPDTPRTHLPEEIQGPLAELGPDQARQLRAMLLKRLNR